MSTSTGTMGKTPQLVWLITGASTFNPLDYHHIAHLCVSFCHVLHIFVQLPGGSSGLGLALVQQVLARGDLVIAPVRDPQKLFSQLQPLPNVPTGENRVHAFKFDLTDSFESMQENVDEAVKVWGRIDVLVNNAGRSTIGTLEEGG